MSSDASRPGDTAISPPPAATGARRVASSGVSSVTPSTSSGASGAGAPHHQRAHYNPHNPHYARRSTAAAGSSTAATNTHGTMGSSGMGMGMGVGVGDNDEYYDYAGNPVRSSSRASSAAGSLGARTGMPQSKTTPSTTAAAAAAAAAGGAGAGAGGRGTVGIGVSGGFYSTGSTNYPTHLSPFGGDDDDDDGHGTVTLHMPRTPSHGGLTSSGMGMGMGGGAVGGSVSGNGYLASSSAPPSPAPSPGPGGSGTGSAAASPSSAAAAAAAAAASGSGRYSQAAGGHGSYSRARTPAPSSQTSSSAAAAAGGGSLSGAGAGAGVGPLSATGGGSKRLGSSSSSTNLAGIARGSGGGRGRGRSDADLAHIHNSSSGGVGGVGSGSGNRNGFNDIDLTTPGAPPSAAVVEAALATVFAAISSDPSAQASFARAVTKKIAVTSWEPLAAYLIAYSTMGVGLSLIGPTMLVLGRQVGTTSTSSLSLTYVGRAIGFFIGSLCGGQLVDRLGLYKGQIILCVAVALSAASTLLYPAANTLTALVAISGLSALFIGCVDNLSQVLLIRTCGQYSEALVQALHAGFAVGSFLAPMVISFFLTEVEPEGEPLKSSFYKNAFYAMAGYMAIVCVLVSIVTIRKRGPFGMFANHVQDCERAVAAKDSGVDISAVAPFVVGAEPAMSSLTLPAHALADEDDANGDINNNGDIDDEEAENGLPSRFDDHGAAGASGAGAHGAHGAHGEEPAGVMRVVPLPVGGAMAGETLADLKAGHGLSSSAAAAAAAAAAAGASHGDASGAGIDGPPDLMRSSSFSSTSSSSLSSTSLPPAAIAGAPYSSVTAASGAAAAPAGAGAASSVPLPVSSKGAKASGKRAFMSWVRNRPSFRGNGGVLLVAVSIMLFFYVGAETGYGHFISPYANKRGFMDDHVASLLSSVFWGSFAVGRVMGIPIAAYVPVDRLAMANVGGAALTALMLTIFKNSIGVLWAGTALIGLCMASLYASCVVWLDHRIHVSGSVLSVVVVCVSLSEALVPLVMGASFGLPAGPVSMMIIATVLLFACAAIFAWVHRYAARHAVAPAAATAAEVVVRGGRRGRKDGDVVDASNGGMGGGGSVELPGYRPQRDLVVVGVE